MHLQHPPPPQADAYPIFGSALQIARDGFVPFLVAQHRKHGPVFSLPILRQRYKVMAGAAATRFAQRHADDHLTGREIWRTFSEEIKARHFIATLDGAEHRQSRKVIKEPYSRRSLERQWDNLWRITDDFVEHHLGQEHSAFALMQKLVSTQLGILLLDRPPGEYLADFSTYLHTLVGVTVGIKPKFALKMPGYRRAKARVSELAQIIIDEHKATERESADLADSLLQASREYPIMFAEEDLTFSILGPYVGGLDTVAGTLAFTLYAIHNHGLTEPLRDELSQFDTITPATMRHLPKLHAAILESMRYFPVAPIVPRTVAKPFEFAGHRFEVGEKVMVATSTGHRDAAVYREPDRFDIERCLPPRNEHKQPGAFAPYGIGSHTCAAAGFADLQIMTTVALLLKKFDVKVASNRLKLVNNGAIAPGKSFKIAIQAR